MCVYIYMWYIYVYLYIYIYICCMCTYICDIMKYSIIYSIIIIMPIFPVVLTGCSVDRPWISGNRDSTTNCSCTGSTTRTFMARPKRRPDMVTWWWLGLCFKKKRTKKLETMLACWWFTRFLDPRWSLESLEKFVNWNLAGTLWRDPEQLFFLSQWSNPHTQASSYDMPRLVSDMAMCLLLVFAPIIFGGITHPHVASWNLESNTLGLSIKKYQKNKTVFFQTHRWWIWSFPIFLWGYPPVIIP